MSQRTLEQIERHAQAEEERRIRAANREYEEREARRQEREARRRGQLRAHMAMRDEANRAAVNPAPKLTAKTPERNPEMSTSLRRQVEDLERRVNRSEQCEKDELLATRPDFNPELRAALAKESLAVVRAFLDRHPESPAPQRDYEPDAMDKAMGLVSHEPRVHMVGTRLILPVMTPEQAKAQLRERR